MTSENQHDDEFEDFISEYNFNLAWYRLQRSSRHKVKHRLGLDVYAPQNDKHIAILKEKLLRGEYRPDNAENVYLPKKHDISRRFAFLSMDDRLVYQAIGNQIIKNSYETIRELADSKRLYANIPQAPGSNGNWSYYVFERVFTTHLDDHPPIRGKYDLFVEELLKTSDLIRKNYPNSVLLRTDVASFYPSIPHEPLIDLLTQHNWLDEDGLLKDILRDCLSKWRENAIDNRGLPIGYETSDYLANLYLLELDNQLENEKFCVKTIRYVDDIYIFIEDGSQENQVKKKIELLLDHIHLEASIEKTKSYVLKDTSQKQIKQDVRINLSHLVDAYDVSDKQEEILNLFDGFFIDSEYDNCDKRIKNNSVIGFVLYRLDKRIKRAWDATFCLLQESPRYARHAVTYLVHNNFSDGVTVEQLWRKFNETVHWQVKVFILDGLKSLGQSEDVKYFILEEYSFDWDWDFQYHILDVLSDSIYADDFYDFYCNIANTSNYYLVQAKALRLAFESTKEISERIKIINTALANQHEFVKKLGIYLWRLQSDIPQIDLDLHLLGDLKPLFIPNAEEAIRQNFKKIFGDIFHEDFPIEDLLDPIEEANVLLIRILDRKDNDKMEIDELVRSLHQLCEIFMLNVAKIIDNDKSLDCKLDELLNKYFPEDNSQELTSFLREWYKNIKDGKSPHPSKRHSFLLSTTNLFKLHLKSLHEAKGLNMPETKSFDVFISYHHADMDEVVQFCEQLKAGGVAVWRDKEQTPFGGMWKKYLAEGLKCDIGLVCIGDSGMGPWQQMEYNDLLNKAVKNEKVLIPVLLESAPDSHEDLPPALFMPEFQWFDLRKDSFSKSQIGVDDVWVSPWPLHKVVR